jgi:exopolysaccharide biosynthesis polyprenyl glycosylphosphotransferase
MSTKSTKTRFTILERKMFLRSFDVLFVLSGLFIATNFVGFGYFDLTSNRLPIWFTTLTVYFIFICQVFEMYNLENSSNYFSIILSVIGASSIITLLYVFTPFITPELPEKRIVIVYLFMGIAIPLFIWRMIYIYFLFSPKYFSTVLLLGSKEEVLNMLQFINKKATTNQVVACIADEEITLEGMQCYVLGATSLKTIVLEHSISEIIVGKYTTETHMGVYNELIHLFERGISILSKKNFEKREVRLMPEFKMDAAFYDEITISRNNYSRIYVIFMRIFDVVISMIGLVFMLLLIPFVCIGNLLANKGALFYYQDRVGKNGVVFKIMKFRTMIENAERNGAEWAQKNDRRVTPFGNFMRITRLDEVPQFFNIMKGEMTLIGPRPERPEMVLDLEMHLPFYTIRHIVRPGLTGWAQVMYPYANSIEDQHIKLRYDLYYIKKRSMFLDFMIIIKTISTVLFFRGQ